MAADAPDLPEIVRLLHGVGSILMAIDAKLEQIVRYAGGDDEAEEADS